MKVGGAARGCLGCWFGDLVLGGVQCYAWEVGGGDIAQSSRRGCHD